MRKQFLLAAMLLMVSATILLAHDLFLKLETYFVPPNARIRVAVLNGSFSASEAAVTSDRLRDLTVVGPAGRTQLSRAAWSTAGDSTWLTLRVGVAGTYVVGASLSARQIQLKAEDFNNYLKEDGIPDMLDARTRAGELGRPAREEYQKHVKAILQVGAARSGAFAIVLGYPAEIVPLTNPYQAHLGDSLALRCIVDGHPAANQLVIAGGETGGRPMPEVRARSDTAGIARFVLNRAGKWYVKFIHMVPVSHDSVNYESKWATLTFEVR
ncbi:MAG: hypothetical protein AUG74_17070 [Bacteroidetes bacterium 13_1_20CM_4_60_6]|nr:MAG: hypothetical protein AUG74_17070 [Bacteroidetes bacterium 13_1_20CM_4_60_6]